MGISYTKINLYTSFTIDQVQHQSLRARYSNSTSDPPAHCCEPICDTHHYPRPVSQGGWGQLLQFACLPMCWGAAHTPPIPGVSPYKHLNKQRHHCGTSGRHTGGCCLRCSGSGEHWRITSSPICPAWLPRKTASHHWIWPGSWAWVPAGVHQSIYKEKHKSLFMCMYVYIYRIYRGWNKTFTLIVLDTMNQDTLQS